MRFACHCILLAFAATVLSGQAKEPEELTSSPLAQAFGEAPALWGPRLSPDGSKISFLQMHQEGVTVVIVLDVTAGKSTLVLAGERERFDVSWCDWANDERLLCGFRAAVKDRSMVYPVTRLVAVNADGTQMKVLLERQLRSEFTQFQDNIVDWLPDEPKHVLVQVPSRFGSGVGRLNVYTGGLSVEERGREEVRMWLSDGHGTPRLYRAVGRTEARWFVRDTPESSWSLLHSSRIEDIDDSFSPIGFGALRSELLFFDRFEGRTALFALDLANDREKRLVFAHPTLDVAAVGSLGKHERIVSATYIEDRPRLHFFDERTEEIQRLLTRQFPDQLTAVIDEDWNERFYLVYTSSDRDPGSYYRLDTQSPTLLLLSQAYPALAKRELAPMQAIRYAADDGTPIPAYLTLPLGRPAENLPTIILPHGGPSSRDYWSYDFLVQFLASQGYAVLQSNYRGSDGYGESWRGDGGFRNWRQAVADITDGTEYLIAEGIADPQRICVVGWSYGGYAALLSTVEETDLYRCVVSIAGVTDPIELGQSMRNFVGGLASQLFIGMDEDIREAGSPIARADEFEIPVLLFHAEKDINVPFDQSKDLHRALSRKSKQVEFIEYEHAEHSIRPPRYRIDMLARIEAFLGSHLKP